MKRKEIDFIINTLTPQLVDFVGKKLGVHVRIDPEVGQPHVPIVKESLTKREVTDVEISDFCERHPIVVAFTSQFFTSEVYIGSCLEIAKTILEFINENGLIVSSKQPEIFLDINTPNTHVVQDIGGKKYVACIATVIFFTNSGGFSFAKEILVPDDSVRVRTIGEA